MDEWTALWPLSCTHNVAHLWSRVRVRGKSKCKYQERIIAITELNDSLHMRQNYFSLCTRLRCHSCMRENIFKLYGNLECTPLICWISIPTTTILYCWPNDDEHASHTLFVPNTLSVGFLIKLNNIQKHPGQRCHMDKVPVYPSCCYTATNNTNGRLNNILWYLFTATFQQLSHTHTQGTSIISDHH